LSEKQEMLVMLVTYITNDNQHAKTSISNARIAIKLRNAAHVRYGIIYNFISCFISSHTQVF